MTEDPLTPEAVAAMEQQARTMLVEAHALSGLVESGCLEPTLFLPMVTEGLRCVHVGDGEMRVVAVDAQGEPRTGPHGVMDAGDLARELKRDDGFFEVGWKRRNR